MPGKMDLSYREVNRVVRATAMQILGISCLERPREFLFQFLRESRKTIWQEYYRDKISPLTKKSQMPEIHAFL